MKTLMKQRFGIIRRPWGAYYLKDKETGKQTTLKTKDKNEALRILSARNEAELQPALNLQLARTYLNATDTKLVTRTWQDVMDDIVDLKHGPTQRRWVTARNDRHFDSIRSLPVAETRAEHFMTVLKKGTCSTNVFLRRIHNHALCMDWLLKSVIPRRLWPNAQYRPKRAITSEEHERILHGENNPELRDYYELLWHLGGAQTDVAMLGADAINWNARTIYYVRGKSGTRAILSFGEEIAAILKRRPNLGPLFPMVSRWKESDRAKAFIRRCKLVEVSGVTLHSYRYAWAERALKCGYPERFAQQALGHTSKAVHHAYAKNAEVTVPSLDDWAESFEAGKRSEQPAKPKVVPVNFQGRALAENQITALVAK
jgi:integrase